MEHFKTLLNNSISANVWIDMGEKGTWLPITKQAATYLYSQALLNDAKRDIYLDCGILNMVFTVK